MTITNSNMESFVQYGSGCFVNISGFYCAVALCTIIRIIKIKFPLFSVIFLTESEERESINSSN